MNTEYLHFYTWIKLSESISFGNCWI